MPWKKALVFLQRSAINRWRVMSESLTYGIWDAGDTVPTTMAVSLKRDPKEFPSGPVVTIYPRAAVEGPKFF